MTPEARTAAIYCRISEDREGSHLGVERQQVDCEELAAKLGWRVATVYVDNDLSAYSGKRRPDYEDLLKDMRTGRITGVLAWHTDRLHRSPLELEEYISASETHSASTHTVKTGEIDLSTPSGRAVARTLGVWARYESEHKGERVAAARRQRVAAGKWGGGIRPFGWEADGIALRASESAEIAKASDTLLAGGSLRGIAHDLNGREITTTRGKLWTSKAVADMLRRPRNAGIIVSKGEELGPAPWPPVIPEDTWRGLCSLLDDPRRRTTPGATRRWLGSHLYVCGTCGSNQVICSTAGNGVRANGKKRASSYRCKSRETSATGHHFVRAAEQTDELVTQTIVARLSRSDARGLIENPGEGVDTHTLSSEALALRQRLTDLSDAFALGEISRAQLTSGSKLISERLARIDVELGRASQRNPLVGVVDAEDVRAVWDSLDLSRKRAIVDMLATVTMMPAKRGPRFDMNSVHIEWKV